MSELHRNTIVADAHNDLLMLVARRPKEKWVGYFRDRWIPQLREGGIDVQVLPVFIDDEFRPEGALRETLRMIEAAHRIAEGNADKVSLCRTGAEIAAATAANKIALVLASRGARRSTPIWSCCRRCIASAYGWRRSRTSGAAHWVMGRVRTRPAAG